MKYKILYIEDDIYSVILLREEMEKYNPEFNLLSTSDEKESLEIIRDNEIDIVLLDLNLGTWGGLELFKILYENGIPIPPIIIVSSNRIQAVRTLALKLGAKAFVHKPFEYPKLVAEINRILLGKPEQAVISKNTELVSGTVAEPVTGINCSVL